MKFTHRTSLRVSSRAARYARFHIGFVMSKFQLHRCYTHANATHSIYQFKVSRIARSRIARFQVSGIARFYRDIEFQNCSQGSCTRCRSHSSIYNLSVSRSNLDSACCFVACSRRPCPPAGTLHPARTIFLPFSLVNEFRIALRTNPREVLSLQNLLDGQGTVGFAHVYLARFVQLPV